MALYAIGDLHLHFQTELKAKAQIKDRVWKNHEQKFRKICAELIQPDDTLVLAGDHSWGRNLAECELDMQYISDLPGRKILLRGNHDMFWDAKKTEVLNEHFRGKLFFLQDNYCTYSDYALVGTKGHCFEGPFYLNRRGQIIGWDVKNEARSKKLVDREIDRLQTDIKNILCFSIIRLPISCRMTAGLHGLQRNTALNRSSMHTAMERADSTTAFTEKETASATVWCQAISSDGILSAFCNGQSRSCMQEVFKATSSYAF